MLEPLPDRDSLREFLLGYEIPGDPENRESLRFYASYHADRFVRTLELISDLPPGTRVLELGAAPFYMTVLLRRHLGFDVTAASFFGDYGEEITQPKGRATLVRPENGETQHFDYDVFNVERDDYPYDDQAFDLVVCCEILEHLASDPCHMLRECNRVLRPGGKLFLSTPNVASLANVIKLARGGSIYHSYSADGVYGRHNREYSGSELAQLFSAHGFSPEVVVDDAYPHTRLRRSVTALPPMRRFRDNLFVTGTKQEDAVRRYPSWLYVGYQQKHPAAGSSIVMEDQDSSGLTVGWHDYENWPPGVRWTTERALARLRLCDTQQSRVGFVLHSGPRGVSGTVRVAGVEVGAFVLGARERSRVCFPVSEQLADRRTGDLVELELNVETFVPAETSPGSKDKRRLGVAVEALWLE